MALSGGEGRVRALVAVARQYRSDWAEWLLLELLPGAELSRCVSGFRGQEFSSQLKGEPLARETRSKTDETILCWAP